MDRISDEDRAAVILPLKSSGRLPLDIIMTTPCKSRGEAVDRKITRYFTGRTCSYGHLSDRYAASGNCVECVHEGQEGSPKTVRPSINIPVCIGPGRANLKHCVKCERFGNGCRGSDSTNKLVRAQLAFPDHPAVRRVDAVKVRTTVYKPSKPCEHCGQRAWRHVQTFECAECRRRAWIALTGADRTELERRMDAPARDSDMDQVSAAREALFESRRGDSRPYDTSVDAHTAKINESHRASREREDAARRAAFGDSEQT